MSVMKFFSLVIRLLIVLANLILIEKFKIKYLGEKHVPVSQKYRSLI